VVQKFKGEPKGKGKSQGKRTGKSEGKKVKGKSQEKHTDTSRVMKAKGRTKAAPYCGQTCRQPQCGVSYRIFNTKRHGFLAVDLVPDTLTRMNSVGLDYCSADNAQSWMVIGGPHQDCSHDLQHTTSGLCIMDDEGMVKAMRYQNILDQSDSRWWKFVECPHELGAFYIVNEHPCNEERHKVLVLDASDGDHLSFLTLNPLEDTIRCDDMEYARWRFIQES